jgi:hypothetical protein
MIDPNQRVELASSGRPARLPRAVVLGGAAAALVSLVYLAGGAGGPGVAARGFPLDDSWIHQVYARSIAAGEPFQYNPGEAESGATSPLWAILLSPAHLLHLHPVAWAKGLGMLLSFGGAIAGGRAAAALGEGRAGAAFAVTYPALPYFAFAAVSGTEVPLFVLLLFLAFGASVARHPVRAGTWAGLAILARPEGYLLPLLLAILGAVEARRLGPRRIVAAILRPAVPAVAIAAPWIAYCLRATGRPLPATFYAKAHWFGLFDRAQAAKILAVATYQPFAGGALPLPIALGTFAAGGCLALVGLRRLARAGPAPLAIGLFPILFLGALATELPMGPAGPPDSAGTVRTFYFARYLLPAIPFLYLLWLVGLSRLAEPPQDARPSGGARIRLRAAAACAVVLAACAAAGVQHAALHRAYAWNCRDVEEVPVAAGEWIAASLPAGASIAVSDAGAIRYFGGHRTIDLVGLNSHRLLPLLAALDSTAAGGREEAELRERFWREEAPDYLAVTAGWHDSLLRGRPFKLVARFRPTHLSILGGDEMLLLEPLAPGEGGREELVRSPRPARPPPGSAGGYPSSS